MNGKSYIARHFQFRQIRRIKIRVAKSVIKTGSANESEMSGTKI